MMVCSMLLLLVLVLGGATTESIRPCELSTTQRLPFCNTSLTAAERVADLIGRLTTNEKVGLSLSTHLAIKRLGIPSYAWGTECLHGVKLVNSSGAATLPPSQGATVFPQPIGMAASFDVDLLFDVGNAVSDEARALNNHGTQQSAGTSTFLSCWAPNVNLFRDRGLFWFL
jgi:beta-glucosidase-like glycosyl hydrolase